MTQKKVTMQDIAKELNVSTVSVSKAINGKEGVSQKVREQILQKAEEMGYIFSKAENEQKINKHNIGILVGEHFISKDAYYTELYQNTMLQLAESGQLGLLEIIKRSAEEQLEVPSLVASKQIEGIIVLGQMSKPYLDMIKTFALPTLYMDFYDEEVQEDAVVSDSVYGSCILTNYLIRKGHKKIAFVGSKMSTSSIMDRYIGYYKAMLHAGLPIHEDWVIEDRDAYGENITITMPKEMPTAFVCNSDAVAYDLVKRLKKEGYSVPDDISVVAFDNFIYAELCSPKLTTYGVNVDALVQNVVRMMIEKIEDNNFSVGRVVVSGTMIERKSVKNITEQ